MTGFGSAAAEADGLLARVEIRAVNHRGLKLGIRARPSLGPLEKELRDRVAERLVRGAVDITVTIVRPPDPARATLNANAAQASVAALRHLASELGMNDNLSAADLVNLPGVFADFIEEGVTEGEWKTAKRALEEALSQVHAMRLAEGKALGAVLAELASPVESFSRFARTEAPLVVTRARERLKARLDEMIPGIAAEGAVEREMCLFADRADIREELDRLDSHLAQYRTLLAGGGEAGRRIEFLAQEFLREVNTAASKASDAGVAASAVEAKLSVEKIKEQSANLV